MIFNILLLSIYSISLFLIFLYSLAQLNLLLKYLKAQKSLENSPVFEFLSDDDLPLVTVQLPVYNEMYVIERLLENISKMDYPKSKLEIQVLDDSTDASLPTTARQIQRLQKNGLDIIHLKRVNRQGYKAGALKEGLKNAKGEYIAIFDADFLPNSDWLKKTLPYFKEPKIGVVQTRWGHLNRDYSLLTKIQAFALDFHFIMEQVGRNFGNHFINFNGTAGIWRKDCILDSGNWHGDTLTEDLDLSYRAQLKGWEFKYLVDIETPAELPIIISAAKSQQFRWNKGAAENFQKNFLKLLKDHKVSWSTKFHGFFHLLNSSMFLILLVLAILSVPILYVKAANPEFKYIFYGLSALAVSTLIFFVCYWITYTKTHGGGFFNFIKFIGMFLAFFCVAMGFSLHNSIAVLEGHFGKKSEFIRTPKFNIGAIKENWKQNKYLTSSFSVTTLIEGLLMLYFAFGIYSAFVINNHRGDFGLLPFHAMLFFGFGFVFFKSLLSKA